MHSRGEYPREKKALAELSDCPRSITRLGTGCLEARCFASSKIHTSAIPLPTLLTSPAQPTACSQAGASLPITPVSSLSPGSWQGPCPPTPGTPPGPPQHLPLPPASALRCASASRPAAAAAAAALSFSRPYRASKQPATARLSPRQLLYPCSPPQPASAFGKRKRKRKRKPGAPAARMLPPGGAELGNGDLRSKGFPFSHVLCCGLLNLPPASKGEHTQVYVIALCDK